MLSFPFERRMEEGRAENKRERERGGWVEWRWVGGIRTRIRRREGGGRRE